MQVQEGSPTYVSKAWVSDSGVPHSTTGGEGETLVPNYIVIPVWNAGGLNTLTLVLRIIRSRNAWRRVGLTPPIKKIKKLPLNWRVPTWLRVQTCRSSNCVHPLSLSSSYDIWSCFDVFLCYLLFGWLVLYTWFCCSHFLFVAVVENLFPFTFILNQWKAAVPAFVTLKLYHHSGKHLTWNICRVTDRGSAAICETANQPLFVSEEKLQTHSKHTDCILNIQHRDAIHEFLKCSRLLLVTVWIKLEKLRTL